MSDGGVVVLLVVLVWAAVLILPAVGARAAREAEFLGSIRPGGHPHDADRRRLAAAADESRFRPALSANARRRQVLGGLVVAIGATLVLGLVPTFRLLLVVHLLLVNSCLAYVGLLVHLRDEQASQSRARSVATWRAAPALADLDAYRTPDTFADLGEHADADEHAYAYAEAYTDAGYADEAAYEDSTDERWTDEGVARDDAAYEAYEDGWTEDDEAEAAYVDQELGLRRPA